MKPYHRHMEQNSLALKTIQDLRECYDSHAVKFSSTRKKYRPELDFVIVSLKELSQKLQRPLHIVELGCGDGRFFKALQEDFPEIIASYR